MCKRGIQSLRSGARALRKYACNATAAAIEWKALISLNRQLSRSELIEYNVFSDVNCWMWAVLNDFDLVENAKSPAARGYRMIFCVRQLMYDCRRR
eukprot:2561587-Pleurochrysis_carterae.AAC.1